jgi:hypothetical protein
MTEIIRIKLRRDLASRWSSLNPILLQGEPGFERDTGLFKIGNGLLHWNDLPYFVPETEDNSTLSEHVLSEDPHPVYDDGRSFFLLYENAKV